MYYNYNSGSCHLDIWSQQASLYRIMRPLHAAKLDRDLYCEGVGVAAIMPVGSVAKISVAVIPVLASEFGSIPLLCFDTGVSVYKGIAIYRGIIIYRGIVIYIVIY